MQKIIEQIAQEIRVGVHQVKAAVELLDSGATVPFIARYRKEVTDGLDDIQLRELEHRLGYLRELEDRRGTVLKSIDEQGKLTLLNILENPYPELRPEIERIVRSSRFSVPTKGTAAVSARFIWPVEFKP